MTHQITEKTLQEVEAAAGWGVPLETIAAHIGVSLRTLQRRYRAAIAAGKAKAHMQVGRVMFDKAVKDRDTGALRWWTACQMGWKPADQGVQVYTPPGKTLVIAPAGDTLAEFYRREAEAAAEAVAGGVPRLDGDDGQGEEDPSREGSSEG